MNKKGFTLIELLAVIVILAIITVIAVPKILDVIEKSKQSSAEISAKMYIDTINKSNMLSETNDNYKKYNDGDDINISNITELHIKGDLPTSGKVSIKNSKVIKAQLCISGYMVEYNNGTTNTTIDCSGDVVEEPIKEVYKVVNLSDGTGVTYQSENPEIATVDENGKVTAQKSGEVKIYVIKDNKTIKIYNFNFNKENVPIVFTDGKFKSVTGDVRTDLESLKKVYNFMIDGKYEKNGKYGSMMLGYKGEAYLKFTVNFNVTVTFSSASYSDASGSTGKDAIFYKIDSEGSKIEYSRFTTKNDSKDYASVSFEPGNYILKNSKNYIEFEEWKIE